MTLQQDFRKFAMSKSGISSMVLDDVIKSQNQYLNPYILEERQLNVTQMDVFSRLMMDRIIFHSTSPIALFGFHRLRKRHFHIYQFARRLGLCRTRHLRHYAVYPK